MPWQFFTSAGREKVVEADPNPIGLITPFAGLTAPTSWLLCQGQEVLKTTYPQLYAATSGNASWWTPVASSNVNASNSEITRITLGDSWDQQAYSSESYAAGVYATAKSSFTDKYVMFGLNTDPTTDASYASIDYAWYFKNDGTLTIYENGSPISDHGAYTTSTVLRVQYDGTNITYLKDGVVQRTVARASTYFYFDSSLYSNGAKLNSVDFGTTASTSTFKIPDLRGRAAIGMTAGASIDSTGTGAMGAVNGAAASLGNMEGRESVTLTAAQSGLPAHPHTTSSTGTHNHAITNTNHAHVIYYRGGRLTNNGTGAWVRSADGANPAQVPTQSVGIGAYVDSNTTGITITDASDASAASAHNNMQGYLVTNFIIKAL